jgi:hypothetical protein
MVPATIIICAGWATTSASRGFQILNSTAPIRGSATGRRRINKTRRRCVDDSNRDFAGIAPGEGWTDLATERGSSGNVVVVSATVLPFFFDNRGLKTGMPRRG